MCHNNIDQVNCDKEVTLVSFLEHQYTGVNLYDDDIPVQADNLIIAIRNGSNASLTLIKVLGKGNPSYI